MVDFDLLILLGKKKGVSYNLPLHVRILPDFPASAPVVFLVPTPDMAIVKQHKV